VASIDQQFIEYIVKELVGHPDDVVVERRIDEKGVLLELTVNPEDLGRVIGKRGVTAQSLRTLLRALGTKNDARYNLKIINNDEPDGQAPAQSYAQPAHDDSTNLSDDDQDDSQPVDDVTEAPVENEPEVESDLAKNTRQELADLDDLDV
jgi:predicted RNA-binding protein YlqC (UPF0109 family)